MGVIMLCIDCGERIRYRAELCEFEAHSCPGRWPVDTLLESEGIPVREGDER